MQERALTPAMRSATIHQLISVGEGTRGGVGRASTVKVLACPLTSMAGGACLAAGIGELDRLAGARRQVKIAAFQEGAIDSE